VEYVLTQPSFRATRGRSETTDHPPIYPTGYVDLKKLRPDHAKVYELVVRRFLATVAPDSTGISRKGKFDVAGETFEGRGQLGAHVTIDEVRLAEDQTKPPRRFTQGSLIQEMERLGLGTKSTRHDVLQKLFDRHYVGQRYLEPTGTGIAVTEALQAHAPVITRPEMTHRLEEDMELVAQSKKPKEEVLLESRDMLRAAYDLLAKNSEGVRKTLTGALDAQHFVGPCVKCGGALTISRSPRGARWVQCVNNPATCTATYQLPAAGFIEPAPEFLCPQCRVPRVKIIFRGQRPDLYCINPECPENHKAFRIGVCPSCGSALQIRYSFLGKRFVGCSGYPTCRVTYPLPQRGKLEKDQPPCPVCHAPVVTAIEAGRPPWTLCINPSCPTRGEAKKAGEKASAKPAARKAAGASTPRRRTVKSKPTDAAPAETAAAAPAATAAKPPRRRRTSAPKEAAPAGGPATSEDPA
ncbi:MAG: DNA topoisomerase, partial [Thermoplasmata archaeon]|nr:DNA topoisomerase [Thermoplasmata archaeon]